GDNPTISAPIDYEEFCRGPVEKDWFAVEEEVGSMSVRELKRKMDKGESLTLIDVRESDEFEIAKIPGSRLIPLSEFERRLTELPRSGALVFHCHSGGRSAHAAQLAKAAGFENVYNLEGGIDAWSVEIDPAVL